MGSRLAFINRATLLVEKETEVYSSRAVELTLAFYREAPSLIDRAFDSRGLILQTQEGQVGLASEVGDAADLIAWVLDASYQVTLDDFWCGREARALAYQMNEGLSKVYLQIAQLQELDDHQRIKFAQAGTELTADQWRNHHQGYPLVSDLKGQLEKLHHDLWQHIEWYFDTMMGDIDLFDVYAFVSRAVVISLIGPPILQSPPLNLSGCDRALSAAVNSWLYGHPELDRDTPTATRVNASKEAWLESLRARKSVFRRRIREEDVSYRPLISRIAAVAVNLPLLQALVPDQFAPWPIIEPGQDQG